MNRKRTIALFFIAGIIGAAEFDGCSESTHPYYYSGQEGDRQSSVGASITSDELTVARISGVPIDSSDGVFSIGWNQFVGSADQDSERQGDASAVVFDTVADLSGLRASRAGEDIGSVYLNYSGNHHEFRKIRDNFSGTFYSLFPRLFGQENTGVSFSASTSYEFEVTGSSAFPATKVSIESPASLIHISNYVNGQQVNADSDMVVSWSGGNPVAGVLIRIIPVIVFGPDGFALSGSGMRVRNGGTQPGFHDGGLDKPVQIDTGYTLLLATNSGKAVVPAAVIQQLLSDTSDLSVTISEFSTVEFNQDGRKYLVLMRDGDRRIVVAK